MPRTNPGKWSVGLILAMFLFFVIGSSLPNALYKSAPEGSTLLDDIVHRPLLALSMLAGVCSGISALITGIVAVLKRKERSILVFGSTLVGAAVTIFVAAMFLFPE
ncbi:MAG: hypothetical protein P8Y68_17700 [Anaerolineales bacterium]